MASETTTGRLLTKTPPHGGHAKANGHASAHAGGVAAAIRAHGGRYEDDIVREAQRFRVPASLVCAVIEVESSFRNVFGHDTVRNPIKSPPRGVRAVTEDSYRVYLRHRKLGEGSQGVGPIPIARRNGIGVTPRSVEQANHAHSLNTTSGNRSDHKGPPDVAWAADMSNGGSPTPQMDKLAADLARTFGISWPGSGLVNHTDGRHRYQLIYRTNLGGNHFNHVHLGVKKL